MKKKSLAFFITISLLLTTLNLTGISALADVMFSGGSGTASNPYLLSSAEDLMELSALINDDWTTYNSSYRNKYFSITKNINLNDSSTKWRPIGSHKQGHAFSAHVFGNKHTITLKDNIFSSYFSGEIRDLTIDGIIVLDTPATEESTIYGSFVGYNTGTIANCVFKGHMTSPASGDVGIDKVGGIVGVNTADIINCYVDEGASITIDNSKSTAGIYVGGIAATMQHSTTGDNKTPSIVNCYSRAAISTVSSKLTYIGGIVAFVNCRSIGSGNLIVENCYASGSISAVTTGSKYLGGICGYKIKADTAVSEPNIRYCYADVNLNLPILSAVAAGLTNAENCAFVDFETGFLVPAETNVTVNVPKYFNAASSAEKLISALKAYVNDNSSRECCSWKENGIYPDFILTWVKSIKITNNGTEVDSYFKAGDITVVAAVENKLHNSAFVIAKYNTSDSTLIDTSISTYDSAEDTYTVTMDTDLDENTSIKIFSFASFDSLIPLEKAIMLKPYSETEINKALYEKIEGLEAPVQDITSMEVKQDYDAATAATSYDLSRDVSKSDVAFGIYTPEADDINQTKMVRTVYTPTYTIDETTGIVTYTKDTYPYFRFNFQDKPDYHNADDENDTLKEDAARFHYSMKVRKNTSGSQLVIRARFADYDDLRNDVKDQKIADFTKNDKLGDISTNTSDFYKIDYFVDCETGLYKIYYNDSLYTMGTDADIQNYDTLTSLIFVITRSTTAQTFDIDDVAYELYPSTMTLDNVINYQYSNTKVTSVTSAVDGIGVYDRFSTGTLTSKISFSDIANEDLAIIAAQSDSNEKVIKASVSKVKADGTLEVSLGVTAAQQNRASVYLVKNFDTDTPTVLFKRSYDAFSDTQLQEVTQLFPSGTTKALTLSYDDGNADTDKNVLSILNKYGLKATFNIACRAIPTTAEKQVEYAALYHGHEIASHGFAHKDITTLSEADAKAEIYDAQLKLQEIFGTTPVGYIFPYGTSIKKRADYETVFAPWLKSIGILYGRTIKSTNSFDIPTDWIDWNPTCTQTESLNNTEKFLNADDTGKLKLYYVWGHAFELDTINTGNGVPYITSAQLDDFAATMAAHTEIWNPTNIEVYNYAHAYEKLTIDGNVVTNGSDKTLYVRLNGKNYTLAPGQILDYAHRG